MSDLRAQEIYGLDRRTFEKLQQLQKIPSFSLFDEVDTSLAPNPPLVYSWGGDMPLPALNCRVQVIQAVLNVLCEDAQVSAFLKLQGPAVAEIQHHPGRYGGMPEVRLPGGTWAGVPRDASCDCFLAAMANAALFLRPARLPGICFP